MSPRLATLTGVAATAALLVVGGVTRPGDVRAGAAASGLLPVTRVQLVCPGLDGSSRAPVQITAVDAGRLLEPTRPPAVQVTLSRLQSADPGATSTSVATAPLALAPAATMTFDAGLPAAVLTAVGQGAANVAASQHDLVPAGRVRGFLSAPCLPATTDSWITGADGRVGRADVLVIANPGTVEADLTVSAWSVTGPVDLPKLQSLTVPAGREVELSLADYAPDDALVTLHIHADSGRVAAAVRDNQTAGLAAAGTDWLAATQPPARQLVVPGYLGGAGPRLLVVTNPGHEDATVRLRLIAGDRAFVPAGHPDLVVPPERSALVDLSTSLGGAAASAELTSDRPVVAGGLSQVTAAGQISDLAWHPATPALTGPAVLAENFPALGGKAVLALSTLDQPAVVRLVSRSGRSRTVQIDAGRTLSVDLRSELGDDGAGPVVVVPVSGSVWASRSIFAAGAHGPLLTAITPMVLPRAIRLPRVQEDLRVAVR